MKKLKRILILGFSRFGFKFIFQTVRIIPLKILRWVMSILSVIFYSCSVRNRIITLRNLKLALGNKFGPGELARIAKGTFNTMGQILIDTVYFKQVYGAKGTRDLIRIEGLENLDRALKKGKGVIGVSAHLGVFTLLGYRLVLEGYKINFVARHMRDEKMERIFLSLCREIGLKIIFSRPIFTCMRQCIKALNSNEVVVIELDQNFGNTGLKVNFFGRPAMVPTGPLTLSMHTGAVILPMFIFKDPESGNGHCIKIEAPVELKEEGSIIKNNAENLQKVVTALEKYIYRYPEQWTSWVHKRWDV